MGIDWGLLGLKPSHGTREGGRGGTELAGGGDIWDGIFGMGRLRWGGDKKGAAESCGIPPPRNNRPSDHFLRVCMAQFMRRLYLSVNYNRKIREGQRQGRVVWRVCGNLCRCLSRISLAKLILFVTSCQGGRA